MNRKILLIMLAGAVLFCGKKSKLTVQTKPPANEPTESCPDLDPQMAFMRCNNGNLEYCSSFSKFKWLEAQKCPVEKTCFVAPDGKAGGCR